MQSRLSTLIRFQVDREITEDAHRQFAQFPTDLHRNVENEKTVDASLIGRHRRGVAKKVFTAAEMDIKAVAAAGVIVEGRRELRVNVFWKGESRTDLPRQQESVGVRNQLVPAHSPG